MFSSSLRTEWRSTDAADRSICEQTVRQSTQLRTVTDADDTKVDNAGCDTALSTGVATAFNLLQRCPVVVNVLDCTHTSALSYLHPWKLLRPTIVNRVRFSYA